MTWLNQISFATSLAPNAAPATLLVNMTTVLLVVIAVVIVVAWTDDSNGPRTS
jgi:hypothetical protein